MTEGREREEDGGYKRQGEVELAPRSIDCLEFETVWLQTISTDRKIADKGFSQSVCSDP